LRVQNAEASRAMLRRPDAAYLPAGLAGRGYFMVGERGVYKQFQTAYVGADYTEDTAGDAPLVLDLITDDGEFINLLHEDENPSAHNSPDAEPYTTAAAVIDVIRDYTEAHNLPYMPPLLLPPLEDQITLEEAFVQLDFGGWNGAGWDAPGTDELGETIAVGSAPIGLVDDVFTRQQYPLWAHLNRVENGGHLLVFGGPGAGKTTLLQTLALSQAWLHSPDDLHIYPLSFTGSGLNTVGNLPHAERTVHGTEPERVRRLFGRLLKILDARQSSRAKQHKPTILLLLDGYEGFRDTYYEQHMSAFERLISEGRGAGVFVAFTASTVTSVPDRVRSLVPQRIALHLNNSGDYLLAVGEAPTVHNMPKGRGFVPGAPPLTCQVSLPAFGGAVGVEDAEADLRRLVNDMRQALARAGRMQAPAPITELAAVMTLESLDRAAPIADRLITTLGQCDDDDLSTFTLDWAEAGPHFVVSGPPAGGKTNLLHAAALSAALNYPPDTLRFLLIDLGGRALTALEPLKHVIARVTNSLELETQFKHLASEVGELTERAASGDTVPKTVLVIDDYEIAADVMSMNLDMLRQLRDHARLHTDAGLHIWVAGYLERVGDPLMKQLLLRRSGFALREREALQNLGVRANVPSDIMPIGRAYFAQQNRVQVVQTALVDDPDAYVDFINHKLYPEADPADWLHPSTERIANGRPQSRAARPSLPEDNTPGRGIDIDTAGLIDDLFGD
ncbi:MAG: FtsK/SpoIIIE domain-containing protein, partial [Chloroflexota bacterium]